MSTARDPTEPKFVGQTPMFEFQESVVFRIPIFVAKTITTVLAVALIMVGCAQSSAPQQTPDNKACFTDVTSMLYVSAANRDESNGLTSTPGQILRVEFSITNTVSVPTGDFLSVTLENNGSTESPNVSPSPNPRHQYYWLFDIHRGSLVAENAEKAVQANELWGAVLKEFAAALPAGLAATPFSVACTCKCGDSRPWARLNALDNANSNRPDAKESIEMIFEQCTLPEDSQFASSPDYEDEENFIVGVSKSNMPESDKYVVIFRSIPDDYQLIQGNGNSKEIQQWIKKIADNYNLKKIQANYVLIVFVAPKVEELIPGGLANGISEMLRSEIETPDVQLHTMIADTKAVERLNATVRTLTNLTRRFYVDVPISQIYDYNNAISNVLVRLEYQGSNECTPYKFSLIEPIQPGNGVSEWRDHKLFFVTWVLWPVMLVQIFLLVALLAIRHDIWKFRSEHFGKWIFPGNDD